MFYDSENESDDDGVKIVSFNCTICGQNNTPEIEWCVCGSMNPYYDSSEQEHVLNTYSAINRFSNSLNPFELSTDETLVCKAIFDCIETFYNETDSRKNLPSQSYTLYKVFELAKLYQHLPSIKLPNQSTVITLDRCFKLCCMRYGWEYKPTTRSAYKTHPILINGEIRDVEIN